MATKNKQLLLAPEVIPVIPEVAPEGGPEIVYLGEGAEKVVFTVNPLASKYTVYASGLVLEELK